MQSAAQTKNILRELFASQKLAVLATHNRNRSYASLVAFAATKNLKTLVFATTRATRKYANLLQNPHVALLVDNRSNREADFHQAIAVTATGKAAPAAEKEEKRLQKLYLAKHPHLQEFVSASSCELFKVELDTYYLVSRFQNVVELHIQR